METATRMTLLSFLAYHDFYEPDCTSLAQSLTRVLTSVQDALSFTELCWGPAATRGPGLFSECLVFVVRDRVAGEVPEYTLVVRGTNPISVMSWIWQDLDVAGQTPWPRRSPHTTGRTAHISRATDHSLALHLALADEGRTLLDWLLQTVATVGSAGLRLNVCGHSLGGLMSATLALWLHDELVYRQLRPRVALQVHALAGPTAGDGDQAGYAAACLGEACTCYVNRFDIATRAWNEPALAELPGLYGDRIPMKPAERRIWSELVERIRGLNYQPLAHVRDIPSAPNLAIGREYLLQAAYQHVFPYLRSAYLQARPVCLLILSQVIRELVRRILSPDPVRGLLGFSGGSSEDFYERAVESFVQEAEAPS